MENPWKQNLFWQILYQRMALAALNLSAPHRLNDAYNMLQMTSVREQVSWAAKVCIDIHNKVGRIRVHFIARGVRHAAHLPRNRQRLPRETP